MSDFRYDVNGHLQQVIVHGTDSQGRPLTDTTADHTISYTTDAHGQVLQRDDVAAGGALTVTERYYYLDGNRIGDISNNGPSYPVGVRFRSAPMTGTRYATRLDTASLFLEIVSGRRAKYAPE
ncbi:YD repeat-containing protein [Paraburkholderia megapolitana]|uniref:YD repeat-containing protein n=1 Tax=Paraburkholderia megapolitana TaxID=420953 RepID=A0A1I3VYC1_9BURK|nr:YD repeat-containing protein [Paraburkholderia megapolitana]